MEIWRWNNSPFNKWHMVMPKMLEIYMNNPTIQALANYIGKDRNTLYHMKKVSPKQFQLLWNGWLEHCKQK